MAGMTDLDEMLRTLTVTVRTERYTFVSVDAAPPIGDGIEAVVRETEGDTLVVTVERAEAEGWPVDFVAAWVTLDVHSALEAVGLTAAFSAALRVVAIPCNVIAGVHHDHLLVPADRVDEAVAVLEGLRDR